MIWVILLIISLILWASGKDWESSERNADRRTRAVISAISKTSAEVTSCYSNIVSEQTDYFERFHEDMEKERTWRDNRGQMYRKRIIYDTEGNVIAEEIVRIEQ